jgi:hypothetical protein
MKRNKTEQVRKLLEANPKIKTEQVMAKLGITKSYAYVLMSKARTAYQIENGFTINSKMADRKRLGITMPKDDFTKLTDEQTSRLVYNMSRPRIRMQSAEQANNLPEGMTAAEVEEIVADVSQAIAQHDAVNHPAHYTAGGIETIDFIEAKGLGYHLGNVVKYITRADHKGDRLENLKKAQWYLNREIEKSGK